MITFDNFKEIDLRVAKILEVERIEKVFALPDFYEKYAEKTNELNRQLEEAKEKVKKLYERWEELERMKKEFTGL